MRFHIIPPGGSCRATSSRALQLRWPVFIMPSWAQRCETLGGLTGKFVGQFLMGTKLGLISWLFFKQIPTESFKKEKNISQFVSIEWLRWSCCNYLMLLLKMNKLFSQQLDVNSGLIHSQLNMEILIHIDVGTALHLLSVAKCFWLVCTFNPVIFVVKTKGWPRILHQHTEPKTVTQ